MSSLHKLTNIRDTKVKASTPGSLIFIYGRYPVKSQILKAIYITLNHSTTFLFETRASGENLDLHGHRSPPPHPRPLLGPPAASAPRSILAIAFHHHRRRSRRCIAASRAPSPLPAPSATRVR